MLNRLFRRLTSDPLGSTVKHVDNPCMAALFTEPAYGQAMSKEGRRPAFFVHIDEPNYE